MSSNRPRKHKRYPLDQSPLFCLRGKGEFEQVVGVSWDEVPNLIASESYRVWLNKKQREIQAPIGRMAKVHKKLGALLARIEMPDYVFSQKGRSYADNGRQHLGVHPLIKTDIHKLYPSITRTMVFQTFLNKFQCAADVADRLANIVCYKQAHLPTGSPLSGQVAFFTAQRLFDEISLLAERTGCTLTVYVDDITLSGPRATKRLLADVRRLIAQHGLTSKTKKSKTFAPNAPKNVTGVIVAGNELRLPNERHRRIQETRKALRHTEGDERRVLQKQLRGRQQEAAQVLRSE